ncbi:MAG: peptide-methionine (S)-S-oxide reductase MsrA [Planctomycetota bacterium]
MRPARPLAALFVATALAATLVACDPPPAPPPAKPAATPPAAAPAAGADAAPKAPTAPADAPPSQETPAMATTPPPAPTALATFGGGCFWCTEAVFLRLKGVVSVASGYAGGTVANPTYEQVSSGETGHAEVIQVRFDPAQVKYEQLLEVFFKTHDPTTLNRQGADVGTQYRSVIFTHDDAQKKTAEEVKAALEAAKAFDRPIVTEITPYKAFYKAEDYHQGYYDANPRAGYCRVVIAPKLEKLEKVFADRLKR